MIPVTQTILHIPGVQRGNCFAACIASLFEVPLDDDVPNFSDAHGPLAWWDAARAWCRAWGYDLARIDSLDDVTRWADRPPGDHVLATVPSTRGPWSHCVVIDRHGVVVCDPYPGAPTGYVAQGIESLEIVTDPYDPFPTKPMELEP